MKLLRRIKAWFRKRKYLLGLSERKLKVAYVCSYYRDFRYFKRINKHLDLVYVPNDVHATEKICGHSFDLIINETEPTASTEILLYPRTKHLINF